MEKIRKNPENFKKIGKFSKKSKKLVIFLRSYVNTKTLLDDLIIVQAVNKRAGRNFLWKKINVQYLIRPCRLEFLIKINNCAARLFGSLE